MRWSDVFSTNGYFTHTYDEYYKSDMSKVVDLDIGDWFMNKYIQAHRRQSVSSDTAIRYRNVTPNYEIVPTLRTPSIDPGDTITIDVYFSGYGVPELNRLSIFHNLENILTEGSNSTKIISKMSGRVTEDNTLEWLTRGTAAERLGLSHERSLPGPNAATPVPPIIFVDDPGMPTMTDVQSSDGYPYLVGETFVEDQGPLKIEIETKDLNLKPYRWYSGDYPIKFSFLYGDYEEVNISADTVTVHVRTRTEKFWWPALIIATVSILTLFLSYIGII